MGCGTSMNKNKTEKYQMKLTKAETKNSDKHNTNNTILQSKSS